MSGRVISLTDRHDIEKQELLPDQAEFTLAKCCGAPVSTAF
jgi:hypothetical protein